MHFLAFLGKFAENINENTVSKHNTISKTQINWWWCTLQSTHRAKWDEMMFLRLPQQCAAILQSEFPLRNSIWQCHRAPIMVGITMVWGEEVFLPSGFPNWNVPHSPVSRIFPGRGTKGTKGAVMSFLHLCPPKRHVNRVSWGRSGAHAPALSLHSEYKERVGRLHP